MHRSCRVCASVEQDHQRPNQTGYKGQTKRETFILQVKREQRNTKEDSSKGSTQQKIQRGSLKSYPYIRYPTKFVRKSGER